MNTKNTDLLKTAESIVDCRMNHNPTIPNEARDQLVQEEYDTLLWDDYSDYGDDTSPSIFDRKEVL